MTGPNHALPEPLARIANRLALFSCGLVLVTLVLHRLFSFPTSVALNMLAVAAGGAALALSTALIAVVKIWITGRSGAWSAAGGIVFAGALLAIPLAAYPTFRALPRINDLTTDTQTPPRFIELAKARGSDANKAVYPGSAFAQAQIDAYPDVRPLVINRSAEEVYDLVLETMRGRRGLGWKVAAEEPPTMRPAKAGWIEATERTLVFGFTDDIVVRVTGDDRQSRIDIRSASRYGRHDFGANAARIRKFLTQVTARLETVLPSAVAGRGGVRASQAEVGGLKRPRERTPETAAAKRGERDPAPPDGRRGPREKATPRG